MVFVVELDGEDKKRDFLNDNVEPSQGNYCSDDNCDNHSARSWKEGDDTNSLGSWKDGANGRSEPSVSETANGGFHSQSRSGMSWADMAQEDELAEEEELQQQELNKRVVHVSDSMGGLRITQVIERPTTLSRDQREHIRFRNVKRKKDYMCFEKINGKLTNIVQGLELHTGVFSAVEQKRIVECVYALQEKGKKGELNGWFLKPLLC